MASTPITNPTPKARFQESGDNISKHRDMIGSKEFQRGCDSALLQYQAVLGLRTTDMATAAANQFKLLGAQEFLQELRLLAEMPVRSAPVLNKELDHTLS